MERTLGHLHVGRSGQAFNFNGVNQRIMVADSPDLRFTNAMSVEAWIYPRSVAGAFHEILSKWGGAPNNLSYTFSISPAGFGYLTVSSTGGGGSVASVFSTNVIPANQWSHVVATYDGANLR